MSYTKKNWQTGEFIEAGELNHMEDGIAANDAAIGTLQTDVDSAEDDIDSLESRMSTAESNIGQKAAASTVDALATRMSTAESDIDALETSVGTKASQSDLAALTNRVAAAETELSHLPDPAASDGTFVITQNNGNLNLADFEEAGIGDPADLEVDEASNIVSAINAVDANVKSLNDQIVVNSLNGTKKTYDTMMKQWFLANGVNVMTAAGITELCNRWYTITRTGWDGYTEFALPDQSAVSTGTRGGDNAGLSCTPSTDTVANTDDFAGLPLFACVDVNYTVDPTTLDVVVTAIDGITDNFVRNDSTKFVGVMQMSGWHYYYDTENTYVHGYADHQVDKGTCEPLPESVRVDGTIRPFVVHSKYMAKVVDGKLTSYAGVIPTAYTVSHNSIHGYASAIGSQYSGGSIVDYAFLILMTYIKYASLTLDGILQGCCQYNYQHYAKVAETGVKRVILSQAQGANIKVGSGVIIGNYGGNADRNQSAMYSITGQAGATVTSVEDITIDGTTYKAVYVDMASTFDTVVNGDAVNGTTVLSTFHWPNGSCDSVLGNDGSPVSATNGQYPAKLQGIEYMVGGYEAFADVILNIAAENGVSYYTPNVVKRSANQATSITSNYTALSALKIECPAADSWNYIKRLGFASGVFSPILIDGSSSTFTRDAFYMNKQGTTGLREWLAFGYLGGGSGVAGLSCLDGNTGLGTAGWHILARLSPNGNRGEWAA